MKSLDARILVAIFHKPGKDDENFELLKVQLASFEIYIPRVNFFGNKWKETKAYVLSHGYDSLFIICSDVKIVMGDIGKKIREFATSNDIGVYGFGTVNNCTFTWLKYNNIEQTKSVPFIEGYCFGVNKGLLKYLELENVYGYGLDVEMGYKSHLNKFNCILSNDVCISHAYGKSYNDHEATREYESFLLGNPHIHKYLKDLNIYTPV